MFVPWFSGPSVCIGKRWFKNRPPIRIIYKFCNYSEDVKIFIKVNNYMGLILIILTILMMMTFCGCFFLLNTLWSTSGILLCLLTVKFIIDTWFLTYWKFAYFYRLNLVPHFWYFRFLKVTIWMSLLLLFLWAFWRPWAFLCPFINM